MTRGKDADHRDGDASLTSSRRKFLGAGLAGAVLAGGAEAVVSSAPAGAATTLRVVTLSPNLTSVTLPAATADQVNFSTSLAGGTLAMTAPSGPPADGQRVTFRITSTPPSGQFPPSYVWDPSFRGSVFGALPVAPTGSGMTDYFIFVWRATSSTWDMVAYVAGFA